VRDITERQRSLDLILWQYKSAVLPAMREYVLPSKGYADLVLDSNTDLAAVEKTLFDAIVEKSALATHQQSFAIQNVK
jgi:uridine kinase